MSRSLCKQGEWHTRLFDGGQARNEPMLSDFLWLIDGTMVAVECKETSVPLPIGRVTQMSGMLRFARHRNCDAVLVIDYHGRRRHDIVMVRPEDMMHWCTIHDRKSLPYEPAKEIGVEVGREGAMYNGMLFMESAYYRLRSKPRYEVDDG